MSLISYRHDFEAARNDSRESRLLSGQSRARIVFGGARIIKMLGVLDRFGSSAEEQFEVQIFHNMSARPNALNVQGTRGVVKMDMLVRSRARRFRRMTKEFTKS